MFKNLLRRCCTIARVVPNAMLGRPVWAFVWITRHCEQACAHCYVYDNSRPHMDFEVYRQTINKLKNLGIVFVSIYGGEPALHPQLIDMIRYASLKRRRIFLNTNITVVDQYLLREIVKAGTNILSFSLDRVKAAKSNLRSIENVNDKLQIVSELQAEGYDCALHCNVTWHKQNLREGREVIEYLLRKGNIAITVRPAVFPFRIPRIREQAERLLLDSKDAECLKELIVWIIEKKQEGYPIVNPYSYLRGFAKFAIGDYSWNCHGSRDILSIDIDGRLIYCSYLCQEVIKQFGQTSLGVDNLTLSSIKEYRAIVREDFKYCNTRCYSPAYFCTAYYRNHLLRLLTYYLKG